MSTAVFVWLETDVLPGEGTADAQVQLLTSVHRQRFVLVRFSQVVHSVPDVRVRYRTEFGTKHTLILGNSFIHYWLDGIQNLGVKT